jgi:transitional endoplasmic reticulum ATPase
MGVLLEGEYGCGKTLVANLLARICTEYDWTYILCEKPSDLSRCVKVARRFEPCVVFCEDVDRAVSGTQRNEQIDAILNTIDGIEAKGTEIMVVLTTNHVEQLSPAMRRPGRLDVVVPVGPPDAEAVERMIGLYARSQLAFDADLTEVSDLLAGRTPAVIREVVERAKRTAIVMNDDDDKPEQLDGASLARAARGMRRHLDLLDATVVDPPHPVSELADAIRQHGKG